MRKFLFFLKRNTNIIKIVLFLITISTLIDFFYLIFSNINFSDLVFHANEVNPTPAGTSPTGGGSAVSVATANYPTRNWPSGLPQTWGIIGSAAFAYRITNYNPRAKALAVLGTLGISAGITAYTIAIENIRGFNALMFSWTEYLQKGSWPIWEKTLSRDSKELEGIIKARIDSQTTGNHAIPAVPAGTEYHTSSFIGNINPNSKFGGDSLLKLWDYVLESTSTTAQSAWPYITYVFKPAPVTGELGDLLAQQYFIYISLFIIVVSILLLFFVYSINNIFLHNKDFILKKFSNKFIRFYFNYQTFLAKISLIYLPLLILFGLFILAHGLHFLITHNIPTDNLDLHIVLNRK